ncbi:MAG: 4-demethylwyosine synthase TYW1 [Candidatus Anstonellales archaeon]
MDERTRKKFQSIYRLIGKSSGVSVCLWTKKAITGKGYCYKQKFYNIKSHRCAEISPAVAYCQNNCIYCWRPMEWMKLSEFEEDEPDVIIEGALAGRKNLLSGYGGNKDTNEKIFKEAYCEFPEHWAISLSGEPLLYSKLGALIKELKRRGAKTIFVVTNGMEPEKLAKLEEMPSQLYISLSAPNEKLFKLINRSVYPDGWQRLLKTLSIELPVRRVIRITLIKGWNDAYIDEFAKLVDMSRADFVEVKSYMVLGQSRERLRRDNSPEHSEVREWAQKLEMLSSYRVVDEHEPSRVVLLQRKDSTLERKLI